MAEPSQARSMGGQKSANIYQRTEFSTIDGWLDDNHAEAWLAFRKSCSAVRRAFDSASDAPFSVDAEFAAICSDALEQPATLSSNSARQYFERNFAPHRVVNDEPFGLLTAYYEPIVEGSRQLSPTFRVPLHRRPPDLVNLVSEAARGAMTQELSHARLVGSTLQPFPTREDIDSGALDGQGLELLFVADEVDRFILQVQGSGIIRLMDGTELRVGYDGKNGHPYTSVGRWLIDEGHVPREKMSLEALVTWLRAHKDRGRLAMQKNQSYVFFREMPGALDATGVMNAALTPLRSLAIDPGYHDLGMPIFVDAPEIRHITGAPFRRLMIGQDVGSAIRGCERGDIFAGSGPVAGRIAGETKHPGRFVVLLPDRQGSD